MNTVLWVLQGLLAATYLTAGLLKATQPRNKLLGMKLGWVSHFSDGQVKLIGLAEMLGAVGLIVPWYTGIAPVLTPVAALCLSILMDGAFLTHLRIKDGQGAPALVLSLIALAVAVGRAGLMG